MGTTGLAYSCRVCKGCFNKQSEWLVHLLQDVHQKLAIDKLTSWTKEERARVLVVYAYVPVGRDANVIRFLSNGLDNLVTEFIYGEGRPTIGFVEFQDRERANEVAGSMQNSTFRIEPDEYFVRKGDSLSDFEWRHVIQIQKSVTPPAAVCNVPGASSTGCTSSSPSEPIGISVVDDTEDSSHKSSESAIEEIVIDDDDTGAKQPPTESIHEMMRTFITPNFVNSLSK